MATSFNNLIKLIIYSSVYLNFFDTPKDVYKIFLALV